MPVSQLPRLSQLYSLRPYGYQFTPAEWYPPAPPPNTFYIQDDYGFLVPGEPLELEAIQTEFYLEPIQIGFWLELAKEKE